MKKRLALIPLKDRMTALGEVYESTANQLIDVIGNIDPATLRPDVVGMAIRTVRDLIDALDVAAQMWAGEAIEAAYDKSAEVTLTKLEAIGAERASASRYNPNRHDRAVARVVKDVQRDLWKANRTIEKTARTYLSVLSRAATEVKKVPERVEAFEAKDAVPWILKLIRKAREGAWKKGATAAGPGASWPRTAISKSIQEYLRSKLKGQDFIAVRLANGKIRNYNLKAYAELVARTRMRQAQTDATKELCKQFENDLVIYSTHDDPCPDCLPYEGQIFSISGHDPEYPELTSDIEPPTHVNCEHGISPISRRALKWRNQ